VTAPGAGLPDLVVRDEGPIRRIELNRPGLGNSLTRAMQLGIVDALSDASSSPDVRAVVLTAAGDRHFCTGPDLRDPELAPDPGRVPGDAARRLRTGSQAVVSAILDCEKPVVCGLNGTAAGVGASVVLACDLIVAAEGSQLIEIFVRRGLAPDGGAAYLLVRRLPLAVAKELVFFGDAIDATRALHLGLVNAVVDRDRFAGELQAWATRVAAGPTLAIAAAKAMLNRAADTDRAGAFTQEALLVEQVAGSHDVTEGVAAFVERREAAFRGR
jgi:2-(1,2-epoxy-1,2-dihydrophenyl)acetyl-CoA isomerase